MSELIPIILVSSALGAVAAPLYFRSSRLSAQALFISNGVNLLVWAGMGFLEPQQGTSDNSFAALMQKLFDPEVLQGQRTLWVDQQRGIAFFLELLCAFSLFGMCSLVGSLVIYLPLVALFSAITPPKPFRSATAPLDAPPVVHPRPELAIGSREWTKFVTPVRGSLVLYLIGFALMLLGAFIVCLILLVYWEATKGLTSLGHGLLLVLFASAVGLFSVVRRVLKWWLKPRIVKGSLLHGRVHALIAFVVALANAIGLLLLYDQTLHPPFSLLQYGWFVAMLSCPAWLCVGFFRLGRRLRAIHALKRLKKDERAPVLLLRAFLDDKKAVDNANPQRPWWGFWAFSLGESITFEEMVCDLFGTYGPVIAIGRPGELVAPLGASRFWVSDAHWQKVIVELIQESQLVVMIMGSTAGNDGLAWEVRRVIELQQMSNLLLVMPPVEKDEARRRWEGFRQLCQQRLPGYQGGEISVTFVNETGCEVARRAERSGESCPNNDEYRAILLGPHRLVN